MMFLSKFRFCFLAAGTILLVCSSTALGQEQSVKRNQDLLSSSQNRFVLIIKLKPGDLEALKRDGRLRSPVAKKYINRIAALRLKIEAGDGEGGLASVAPFVTEAKAARNGDTLGVIIDDALLNRLEKQPVELKVYYSGFNKVLFQYRGQVQQQSQSAKNPGDEKQQERQNPKASQPTATVSDGQNLTLDVLGNETAARTIAPDVAPMARKPEQVDDSKYSNQMMVRFNSDQPILGRLKDLKEFSIRTDFGKVQIKMADVAGIKFNIDSEANKVFVILKSGDAITARTELEKITVNSPEGTREANLSELESLTSTINVRFEKNKDDRWRLQMLPETPSLPRQLIVEPAGRR